MRVTTRYTSDFRCLHCRQPVSAATWLAGVQHRNHCPYCLYSRHMDLYKAGDRLAACRAVMQPVGLTLKKRINKYAMARSGELMLVHLCLECGKISLNRIAADDDHRSLLALLDLSAALRCKLEQVGVQSLSQGEVHLAQRCLFGRN